MRSRQCGSRKDEQGVSDYERIIYRNLGVGCARQAFTDDLVVELVNTTAAAIENNAADTFRRINAGEAPYRNQEDPSLYVFVYDMNLTMVAHADNIQVVGENFRGKTDVTGKPFRDDILEGALNNGTGWVDYVYMHPVQANLYYKTTYYRLTREAMETPTLCAAAIIRTAITSPRQHRLIIPLHLEELVAFVEKAFEYAHVNGRKQLSVSSTIRQASSLMANSIFSHMIQTAPLLLFPSSPKLSGPTGGISRTRMEHFLSRI